MKAAEQNRVDIRVARRAWWERLIDIDIRRLVFLDEAGAKTNMIRLYGRTIGGRRLVDAAPQGHWGTTTMLSSLRMDGGTAAMVIEGATDTPVFQAYVEHVLVPWLRPTDIVVMDNLSPHKSPAIQEMIRDACSDVWYLPAYSPDFNPIEGMWSKVKALLRKAKARTLDALTDAIAAALQAVTATDARGWFTNCGYRYK